MNENTENLQKVMDKVVELDLNGNEIEQEKSSLHYNVNAITNKLVYIKKTYFKININNFIFLNVKVILLLKKSNRSLI